MPLINQDVPDDFEAASMSLDDDGDDLPEITDMQRVVVQPGDTIVVRFQDSVSNEMLDRIHVRMKPLFPEQEILILDRGATIHAIGKRR